jgi:perosamine synthetase
MNPTQLREFVLSESASLSDAMQSFEKTGLRVVLICRPDGTLTGLATEGDVRRALLAGHGLISPILPHANRRPAVGRTDMSREDLFARLSERVHFLPVLDEQDRVKDILFYDQRTMIPIASPIIGELELRYVTDAVISGWISSQGKYITQFEEQFASFCGVRHAVAVANGTVALHMALTAIDIGPGDEVIVPALTFIATANAVRYCRAVPVFVDVDRATWNIDPDRIEAAITPRTKAIIPVHLYGQPCDMDRVRAIAERHRLRIVEDAAEAHGATFGGRRVGAIGDLGCFSFYGNKIITTGEGGMVVSNDAALDEKLRLLRDHGMSRTRRYWHEVIGFNYRMTNLQAAIGVAQLERWEQIISAKARIQRWYDTQIDHHHLETAQPSPKSEPVCWLYTLMLKDRVDGRVRDLLLDHLKAVNIDSRPVFHPIPAMPPYFEHDWEERYPVSDRISKRGFSLPSSVEMVESDLKRTVAQINGLVETLSRTFLRVSGSRNNGTRGIPSALTPAPQARHRPHGYPAV